MENKWFKKLLWLIAIGAFIGGIITYFTKKKEGSCDCADEFDDDFEDEDFDLDDDLKEVSREYVSLTPEPAKGTEEESNADKTEEPEETDEQSK